MTGCTAPNCSNSDTKGFLMQVLVTPFRVYFANNMWERPRVDEKRKLKITAVPTIFENKAKKVARSHSEQCIETEVQDIKNKKKESSARRIHCLTIIQKKIIKKKIIIKIAKIIIARRVGNKHGF
ncbi:hypothetical protein PUN28_015253 [Cardiocondyla obscurior]|uniref:Uncharacterized protein n=1 Tax=Cardiocondyla obscurior TaxID=286306 RepID=A0AAW2F454_9HYME